MDPVTLILGKTLWDAGDAAFDGAVRRAIPRIVDRVVKRFWSGEGMTERGQQILSAFRDSMIKYGKQSLATARTRFGNWLLGPARDETEGFLNEEGIEMVDMGAYEALDGMDMAAAATAASGTSFGALMAALEDFVPGGLVAGAIVTAGESRKSQGVVKGVESALADDLDSFLHPFRDPWHTLANALDPFHILHGSHHDDPNPKRQKLNPQAPRGGDFAGLVNTFYNPVTSRIIGYKGIPRKRKFSSLERYSSFWKQYHMRTPPTTPSRPGPHVWDSAFRA